ncbi:MAG: zinc ribbon domain-containing protein [Ignavibacteriae bacterium]|nr:zinc ribbon domain-containing protein [Ignavibacteriota bacterium]
MAKSGIACKNCGAALTENDRFCPQCGAKIGESVPENLTPVRCQICGHENKHSGAFCEACGAKLPGRKSAAEPPRQKKSVGAKPKQGFLGKLQPWHYVVIPLLAIVLVILLYTELQRDASNTVIQSPPMQFPAQQQAATPPSGELLESIDRLQKTATENPSDAGAQLLLANALHDAGMRDASYFPRAIEVYKQYLKSKPGDPNARVDLGICYFELGKVDSTQSAALFSTAIEQMEIAVRNTPTHQPGAFNLGIVYLYSGNLEKSNEWLRRTVELNAESDLGRRAKAILEQHKQAG